MIKKIIIFVLLLLSLFSFYKISETNYKKHNEIKQNTVSHPESLPKKDVAKAASFGFQNIKADYYWLKTIQYI
jgi:uncharacterized protein YpmB